MTTARITELRKSLFSMVGSIIKYNDPIRITTKNGNAILLSEKDCNSLLETIRLMSWPDLVFKIKEGEKERPSEMSKFKPDENW